MPSSRISHLVLRTSRYTELTASRRIRRMAIETGTDTVKRGLAQMLKGGVIMDVVTPEHAKIAEEAGACAVMALERVPADIRATGGGAGMSDPEIIGRVMEAGLVPGVGEGGHRPLVETPNPGAPRGGHIHEAEG